MGMTIAEKALARASGKEAVRPGEYVDAKIDRMIVLEGFARMHGETVLAGFENGIPRIWDKDRFHVYIEHLQPALNKAHAERQQLVRKLVEQYGVKHFNDTVCAAIHPLAMQECVMPGELATGNDSHTCAWGALNCVSAALGERELAYSLCFGKSWYRVPESIKIEFIGNIPGWDFAKDVSLYLAGKYGSDFGIYKSLEYCGPAVKNMEMHSRMTIATHTVELGGKFGVFPYDNVTEAFLKQRPGFDLSSINPYFADEDAEYCQVIEVDLDKLEPQVACPHSFDNVVPISEAAGIKINQAHIGSCANGCYEDIHAAAEILRGKHVAPGVRLYIQANSWREYRKCMHDDTFDILIDAGAQILQPGCHLCMGQQGYLPKGETCIASTTRNFRGRLGDKDASVYLASPETIAASALTGVITDHREVSKNG